MTDDTKVVTKHFNTSPRDKCLPFTPSPYFSLLLATLTQDARLLDQGVVVLYNVNYNGYSYNHSY